MYDPKYQWMIDSVHKSQESMSTTLHGVYDSYRQFDAKYNELNAGMDKTFNEINDILNKLERRS